MSSKQFSINSETGISGSLTRLATGESYLAAGPGISIATGSNGQVTISSLSEPTGFVDFEGSFLDLFTFLSSSKQNIQLIRTTMNGINGTSFFIPLEDVQLTSFEGFGLTIDINPTKVENIIFTGSYVEFIKNDVINQYATGSGHLPSWNLNGWAPGVASLVFSASNNFLNNASEYLILPFTTSQQETFSNTTTSWSNWSTFVVFKSDRFILGSQILSLNTGNYDTVFQIENGGINCASEDQSMASGGPLYTGDANKHLIEVYMNGNGTYEGWIDGTEILTNLTDYRPKNMNSLTMCAAKAISGSFNAGWAGDIARILMFTGSLNFNEKTSIRNYLNSLYQIF